MDMCSEIGCGSANRRHGTWEELERMEDQGCWVGKEGGQGEGGREGLGKVSTVALGVPVGIPDRQSRSPGEIRLLWYQIGDEGYRGTLVVN